MPNTKPAPCDDFNLDAIVLLKGSHGPEFTGAACMIECANVAAACVPELRKKYGPAPFADNHPSISPVIRDFCIAWNDGLQDDAERTRLLRPYVTRVLGTKTSAADERKRGWMILDWQARTAAPAWLRLTPSLRPLAEQLENLARITDATAARSAQPLLEEAAQQAQIAYSAADSAADSAAYSAADRAAYSAADRAADRAAYSAADRAAYRAAYSAAYRAADRAANALEPTVLALQESALKLLDDMIAVGKKKGAA